LKILVISDSHNVILDSMIEAVKKEGPFDLLIHCGDKYDDAGRFAQKLNMRKVLKVPGNCDYNYNILGTKANIMQEIEGRKFLITHNDMSSNFKNISKIIFFIELYDINFNAFFLQRFIIHIVIIE
jgi:putative phosphoesterase